MLRRLMLRLLLYLLLYLLHLLHLLLNLLLYLLYLLYLLRLLLGLWLLYRRCVLEWPLLSWLATICLHLIARNLGLSIGRWSGHVLLMRIVWIRVGSISLRSHGSVRRRSFALLSGV